MHEVRVPDKYWHHMCLLNGDLPVLRRIIDWEWDITSTARGVYVTNGTEITFIPQGSLCVTGFMIAGEDVVCIGTISAPQNVSVGDTLTFRAGSLSITFDGIMDFDVDCLFGMFEEDEVPL